MANLDPQAVFNKWKTNTSAASTAYVQGAESTDKDPTQLAINAIPYMRARVLEAIDSGRVANGLRRAGKAGWLAGVQGKGKANFESGVNAAEGRFLSGFTPLLNYIGANVGQIRSMPANSPADRKARMNAWFDKMSAYKSTR